MRTIKKLTIGLAVLAVGVMNAQAQWGDDKVEIEIALVTGEKKILRVDSDVNYIDRWLDYNENYHSIKIPDGWESLWTIKIQSRQYKHVKTIQRVFLPSNCPKLDFFAINGTEIKRITIPSRLPSLKTLYLGNNPNLEIVEFPSGNEGRLVKLYRIELYNTNIETLKLPEGLINLDTLHVQNCSRLHTIVFGKDTNEDVRVAAGGSGLKRIVIPRRLERKVAVIDNTSHPDTKHKWNHLEVVYLEDLRPTIEVSREQGVNVIRWNAGDIYASENPDGQDWRLVGGVELSPLRIPAILQNKLFFRVKPQE